ncbi:MAG: CBS and ACT domain-containing protein [Desulfonauticus sp.]|nr:CBS and ACT domain-containing protein [Desulfonauticus sp.]
MLVKDWMTKLPINLQEDATVVDAAEIMFKNNIRQLPVTDANGKLVGIISDRDVRDALPSKYLPGDTLLEEGGLFNLKVKDIMSIDPIVTYPEETVENVAHTLQTYKIGGLPVVDANNNLIGIITEVDVFKYLCRVTGIMMPGIQLIFHLPDTPGATIDLLTTLRGKKVRLTSVLTSYENIEQGYRKVSIHIQDAGGSSLEELVEALKQNYDLRYYVKDGKAVKVKD